MGFLRLVVVLAVWGGLRGGRAGSFYDNPEWDVAAEQTSAEELEARWGFEVCGFSLSLISRFFFLWMGLWGCGFALGRRTSRLKGLGRGAIEAAWLLDFGGVGKERGGKRGFCFLDWATC